MCFVVTVTMIPFEDFVVVVREALLVVEKAVVVVIYYLLFVVGAVLVVVRKIVIVIESAVANTLNSFVVASEIAASVGAVVRSCSSCLEKLLFLQILWLLLLQKLKLKFKVKVAEKFAVILTVVVVNEDSVMIF